MKKYAGLPDEPTFKEAMSHLKRVFNAWHYQRIEEAIYNEINDRTRNV